MPRWKDLRRFLDRNGEFSRHGSRDDLYYYDGRLIRCSRGSGEIKSAQWQDILKKQLRITQEEFNRWL